MKNAAAIHYTTGKIMEAYSIEEGTPPFSKPVIAAAAELVKHKLSMLGKDLEAFAKHAKRSKITTEDVILAVRRNPGLVAKLDGLSNQAKDDKQEKINDILVADAGKEVIDLGDFE